jgi:hypothetical protein
MTIDHRISVTKAEMQSHLLAQAKLHPSNGTLELGDVIILDKGNGNWGAAFSPCEPTFAEYALAAIPIVQAKYRLAA